MDEPALDIAARRLLDAAFAVTPRRFVLAIAGIPGAGKSTLALRVRDAINRSADGASVVMPMDGFHLSNRELDARGLRDRKGCPETFDALGFIDAVSRARRRESFTFPIYDRRAHEPVLSDAPEQTLSPRASVVIIEGNYLLLDQPPWSDLVGVIDESWFLDTPMETAKQRILARHRAGGRDDASALAHYQRADAANAALVLSRLREPNLRLRSE